jgi:hypothetical protein
MTDKKQNVSTEQFKAARAAVEATSEWLETKASNDDLMVSNSTMRLINDSGSPISRVNFDGKTTRFRPNTEVEIIKGRIASCREAYENAGIVTNAIDLMVDFALEGLIIVHENKTIQRFYVNWMRNVKMPVIIEQALKSFFIDSNVPILSFRGRITNSEVRKMRLATGRSPAHAQNLFVNSDPVRRRVIPNKYAILDVLRLHQEGADLLGNIRYEYDLEPEDKKRLKDPSTQNSSDLRKIREAVGDKEFAHLAQTGRLHINPDRLSLLHYKKDGFRRWANPYLWRTIDDLRFKKLLRDMDISVAESVINTLTIIKLGDTVNGFPATPGMFQKVASLLKVNTKSHNLIWNDLINIQAEYPPVEKILGEAKYEQVNKEIRSALGIPEVILSGAGKGNFANSFIAVRTLIERLEGARQAILRWLTEQVELVAKAMDFKKPPIIKMDHMDLSDEAEQKRLMLDMADRGMLSYQTCIEAFGESFEIEVQRMKEEDQFRRKNEKKFPYVLVKTGKFGPMLTSGPVPLLDLLDSETLDSRQTQDADLIRERQEVEIDQLKNPPEPLQSPTQQGGQGDKGGRPAATKKPQKKSQTPRNKPQGQDNSGKPSGKAAASFSDNELLKNGESIFDKLYNSISKAFVKKLKLKDARSLKDAHKEQIFHLIAHIIPQFTSPKEVTSNNVEILLRATKRQNVSSETLSASYPKLDDNFLNTVRKLIRGFKEGNGYSPTRTEAREIIASAYVIL